jgi:hypothetical protein
MDIHTLCSNFDKKTFTYLRGPGYWHTPEQAEEYSLNDPARPESYHWEEHDINVSQVLNNKTLVIEMAMPDKEKGSNQVETIRVYLCYNWKLKVEYVLVSSVLTTTFSSYTPQYGKDDNYRQHTRCDHAYLAFSVEAFKRLRPELAVCLESL